jgi:hypothetical protein
MEKKEKSPPMKPLEWQGLLVQNRRMGLGINTMIGFFPDFFLDELFYSTVARYLERMKYPNKGASIQGLFGARTYKAILDFPSHLDAFSNRLPKSCGYPTADQVIDQHTLLPLYTPFLPPQRLEKLRKDMHGDDGHAARLRAGIVASKIPLMRELRICPKCVRADRQEQGEAYWHRSHQIQGMKVCHTHEIPLKQMKTEFIGDKYISAEQALKRSGWDEPKPNQNDIGKLLNLAVDANWLLSHPQDQIDSQSLYKRYFTLLAEKGFAHKFGSQVLLNKLSQSFEDYYSCRFLESLHCGLNNHVPSNWLARLAEFAKYSAQHPLHHLLVIHFLGQTAETFFQEQSGTKITGIQANNPTYINWSYHPDLTGFLAHPPGGQYSRTRRRVNWHKRDLRLAKEIFRTVGKIRKTPGIPGRITKRRFFRLLKHSKTTQLDMRNGKLPISRKVLSSAIESREEFALRRITYAACQFGNLGIYRIPKQIIHSSHVARLTSNPKVRSAIQHVITGKSSFD